MSYSTDGYLTKTELASMLRKSKRTIDEWTAKGILPYIKIRRSVLFKWDDVVQALQKFERRGGRR
jgi:excisionase family DNA binding protein